MYIKASIYIVRVRKTNDHVNFDKYGLNQYALVSGFVGLVLADMIDPWVTFVGEK